MIFCRDLDVHRPPSHRLRGGRQIGGQSASDTLIALIGHDVVVGPIF